MSEIIDNISNDPLWFISGHVDEEYQRYRFLAWIQKIEQELNSKIVFPAHDNLKRQIDNMEQILHAASIKNNLDATIIKGYQIYPEPKVIKEHVVVENDTLTDLFDIIKWARGECMRLYELSCNILIELQSNVTIKQLNTLNVNASEGYVLYGGEEFWFVDLYSANILDSNHTISFDTQPAIPKVQAPVIDVAHDYLKRRFGTRWVNVSVFHIETGVFNVKEVGIPVARRVLGNMLFNHK